MYDNDFLGFKFNGVHFTIFPHPSENADNVIKLTRVSDGDRYNDNLLPLSQDATVDVPGGDGTYYFGTNYKTRQFDISFAFDELTDAKIRQIRQVFSKRNGLAPLIFDEEPYKYWMVKCQGMPQLKTVCFVDGAELGNVNLIHTTDLLGTPDTRLPRNPANGARTSNELPDYQTIGTRIYKGEGVVSFIAYYPFARCGSNGTSKWLNGYSTTWASNKIYAPTLEQWSGAAGLAAAQSNYDTIVNNNTITTYNPGDMAADFRIVMNKPTASVVNLLTLHNGSTDSIIYLQDASAMAAAISANGDTRISYNSRTELLEGCNSSGVPTGHLYNRYVSPSSTLFKIATGSSTLTGGVTIYSIDYDYLYY